MWKLMVFLWLGLALPVKLAGQQQIQDSLKAVISSSGVDTVQMRAKWLLGKSYFRSGSGDFFEIFRSGLQQAEAVNSSRWKQEFTLYLGISHLLTGNTDSAIIYLDRCDSMQDAETTPEITYQVQFNLGQAYTSMGNSKEAARYLISALDVVTEPNAQTKKANIYLNLSTLMSQLKDDKKAMEYCRLGIASLEGADNPEKLAMLYSTLSGYFFGQGKPDSALISIQKAISLAEPLPNPQPLIFAYINLITYYNQSGQPDSAEFYFSKIKPLYAGIRKDESYSFLVYQMAEIAFRKKDYKKAEELFLEADSLAESFSYHIQKLQIKKSKAAFYEATGNAPAALKALKEYYFLKDSIDTRENAALSRELEQKFSVSEKEKEIVLLQKDREKQQVIRNTVLIVALLTGIIGLILFFGFRHRGRLNKQLEEKNRIIEAERQRAFRSEQFKQQFLANMSHELRSPMNAILGSVTLALNQENSTLSKKYLETAQKSSKNLLGIINDILDLSKIEAGKLVVEHIPFYIWHATEDVINAQSLLLNKSKQELIFDGKVHKNLKVTGDPLRYMQILTNLVSNAIKFTPEGKIRVRVEYDEQNQQLHLTVSDEGIGMSEEVQASLFQQYHQSEAGTARKYGGTGLGLAITRQLVERMNGSITVKSEVGKGSVFRVILNLAGEVTAERERESESGNANLKSLEGISVYVVDDLEESRMVTADLLKSILTGVKVTTFSNGQELIDALQQDSEHDPAKLCILTDLDMPVLNGIDAVRIIRKQLKRSVPVIALTASAFVGDDDEFRAMGFDGMVVKPFVTSVLIDKMAEVMNKKSETGI